MKSYVSHYTFFDTNLAFETNSRAASEEFEKVYGYFKNPCVSSSKTIVCSLVKNDNSYSIDIKSPRYSICYTLYDEIPADTYLGMFSPVIYEVKDYFLIHAGSLSIQNNQSLIISAPCGFGKTTLTMELLKEGFGFLSDELAPLNVHAGLIHAYPRGMGVLGKSGKKIVPWKRITGNPCKPSCVIFLCLPQAEEHDRERYLELALARFDQNVCRQLEKLPEVKQITVVSDRLFPVLRLSVRKGARVVHRIEQICSQNQVPIMYSLRARSARPDFEAEPELKQILPREGILELSRNVLNAGNSALLEERFTGSRPRMIFELAGLMSQAKFYKLTVGRLSGMTALVKDLRREL